MQTRNFLGPSGTATVILLDASKSSTLPTISEARRLFQVEEISHYKCNGWYRHQIGRLERALEIVKGASPPPWIGLPTCDVLLLPQKTPQSVFFTLKYASILIHGFHLTDAGMTDLAAHIDSYSTIVRWRDSVENFYSSLRHHAASAKQCNVRDQSVLNPNIPGLEATLTGYGDTALAETLKEIKLWHSFHTW